ncbi:MAG: hypothetical protein CL820_00290 [Croceicoccus sp.]|nr:hypothetical protein [Croceicoccus sp.]MAL24326.1 hypothetical protein [Croceicoccus sp.]|tara:strand:+ start:42287 stop:43465 length:1179 start_codon:yes stop_codon:yes gene_type:complete
MNALPFISLSALRSVATPADGAAVAEGGTDGDEGENGAFQPFLELIGLMAAPAAALPDAAPAMAEAAPAAGGTGKNLPLPLLPQAKPIDSAFTIALPGEIAATPFSETDGKGLPDALAAVVSREMADKPVIAAAPRTALPTDIPARMAAAVQPGSAAAVKPFALPDGSSPDRQPAEGENAETAQGERPAATPTVQRSETQATILTARSGGDMQVQLVAAPVHEAKPVAVASAALPDRIDAFQGSQRLEELVQAIAHARESGHAGPVRATISHAEFGPLAVRLTREDSGMSAQIASSDAAFAPAAHAALRSADANLFGQQRGEEQPRHHAAQDQQQAHSQTGSAQTGNQQGTGQGRSQPRPDAPHDAAREQPGRPDKREDRGEPKQRPSGLYA